MEGYALSLIADLCLIVCNFPPTELVDRWSYALQGVMPYERYALRGVRLYIADQVM